MTPGDDAITPLPVPSDAAEILLFGGLFDPPHWAHVELALAARDAVLGPEGWLVYVPAARSPHKPNGPVATDEDRLAMLRLALEGKRRVAVWTDELDRADDEPSYWVRTLERARRVCPSGASIRFLLGADQVLAFHRWHDYRRVLALAEPVVMLREPADDADRLRGLLRETGAWSEDEIEAWAARVIPHETLAMSSTLVRERLGEGAPVGDREGVDERVQDYIRRRGLYAERA